MVNKVFTDDINPEQTMTVYENDDKRCYIEITTNGGGDITDQFITLDSEDLIELISELQSIKNQIDTKPF